MKNDNAENEGYSAEPTQPNLFPPQGWKRWFPEILKKPISTPGVEIGSGRNLNRKIKFTPLWKGYLRKGYDEKVGNGRLKNYLLRVGIYYSLWLFGFLY